MRSEDTSDQTIELCYDIWLNFDLVTDQSSLVWKFIGTLSCAIGQYGFLDSFLLLPVYIKTQNINPFKNRRHAN